MDWTKILILLNKISVHFSVYILNHQNRTINISIGIFRLYFLLIGWITLKLRIYTPNCGCIKIITNLIISQIKLEFFLFNFTNNWINYSPLKPKKKKKYSLKVLIHIVACKKRENGFLYIGNLLITLTLRQFFMVINDTVNDTLIVGKLSINDTIVDTLINRKIYGLAIMTLYCW